MEAPKTLSIQICAFLGAIVVILIQNTSLWLKVCMFVCIAVAMLVTGYFDTFSLLYHTLPRDLSLISKLIRLVLLLKKHEWRNTTVPKMFSSTALEVPDKTMFYYKDDVWTFGQVEEMSNRVANFILGEGFDRGDTIAVFIGNRPEFVIVWLGLSKAGLIPALINYNLKQEALIHSVKTAKCKAIVFGVELGSYVRDVHHELISSQNQTFPSYFVSGMKIETGLETTYVTGAKNLDSSVKDSPAEPVPVAVRESIGFNSPLMYIYTSGTTGLPKAAVIKHSRYILAGEAATLMMGLNEDDTLYCCLPLYHTVGGMLALAGTMRRAIPMVVAEKFSTSNFWKDCVQFRVTAAPYIGEICRYLLNTAECEEEKRHSLRLMFGNGLRPSIWKDFVDRFGIGQIREFYGSTEGNSNIINVDNTVGSVGFVPSSFGPVVPLGLIKVTEEGEAIRDANTGLCVRCLPGEEGEFVGAIVKNHPVRDFPGYSDDKATSRKIINNVWKSGDRCFRSGDILVTDKFGYFYFKDRKGDTFRWKGENVSTAEVESIVFANVSEMDAVVYGVELPGCEGKAGMMAVAQIAGKCSLDLDKISEILQEKLPSFARPVFIRITKELDITGTYKLKKKALQKEGINLECGDPIFYFDIKSNKYLPLLKQVYQEIICQKIRF